MTARPAISFRHPSGRAPAVSARIRRRSRAARAQGGFTLIELILVMAILTVAISFTAPALSHFFGGRKLDNEARRMLALIRHGQGRAVAEGLTMDLWLDQDKGKFGLEVERSFETRDTKGEEFDLDGALKMEVSKQVSVTRTNTSSSTGNMSIASVLKSAPVHPSLPTIRFQADGSIGEQSPHGVKLVDADGASLWVALSKNRMNYEIRNTEN